MSTTLTPSAPFAKVSRILAIIYSCMLTARFAGRTEQKEEDAKAQAVEMSAAEGLAELRAKAMAGRKSVR